MRFNRRKKTEDLMLGAIAGDVTIQIKASLMQPILPKEKNPFRYTFYASFNRFKVYKKADYVILVCMYPSDLAIAKKGLNKWHRKCFLLFTREEMEKLITSYKTVSGEPEEMFAFSFNSDREVIILTRGDPKKSGRNYADHLLKRQIMKIKAYSFSEPNAF